MNRRDNLCALLAIGGNLTGLTTMTKDLGAKELELAREPVPRATRVAVLAVAKASATETFVAHLQAQAQQRLPTIFESRQFGDAGGLVSYGSSIADMLRRSATYIDKIFKGAKPADRSSRSWSSTPSCRPPAA